MKKMFFERHEAIMAVKEDGLLLEFVSEELQSDLYVVLTGYYHEMVMQAVSQNGLALQFASEKAKDNIDIVLTAIKQNPDCFCFASERIKDFVSFNLNKIIEIRQRIHKA